MQCPSRPSLTQRQPQWPGLAWPGLTEVHLEAVLLKKQSKPEPSLHPARPLHTSVCMFHWPAFVGDNYISVCIDPPSSFRQQQTDTNSKNFLCAGRSSKNGAYIHEQQGGGRSAFRTLQARGLGMPHSVMWPD